jgi:hypothetical protein
MEPVAVALHKLQGDEQAYLGCLLLTLAAIELKLDHLFSKRLIFCDPLVMSLVMGMKRKSGFASCF